MNRFCFLIPIGILAALSSISNASTVASMAAPPMAAPLDDLISGTLHLDFNAAFWKFDLAEIPAVLGASGFSSSGAAVLTLQGYSSYPFFSSVLGSSAEVSTTWAAHDLSVALAWIESIHSPDSSAATSALSVASLAPAVASIPPIRPDPFLDLRYMSEARRLELARLIELQQQNAVVPEPSSFLISASAGFGMLLRRRRSAACARSFKQPNAACFPRLRS